MQKPNEIIEFIDERISCLTKELIRILEVVRKELKKYFMMKICLIRKVKESVPTLEQTQAMIRVIEENNTNGFK